MITVKDNVFYLATPNTSYIFRVCDDLHTEQLYYGDKIDFPTNAAPLFEKFGAGVGTSVAYSPDFPLLNLDNILSEFSTVGKGDFREPFITLRKSDGSFINDFKFSKYTIADEIPECGGMPYAYGKGQCLKLVFTDNAAKLNLTLIYTVFEECDVIVKSSEVENLGEPVALTRLMSSQLDLPESDFDILSLDGTWARERIVHRRPTQSGINVIDSKCGTSSNRHNPYIALLKKGCGLDNGDCYGFNLIYSGNFCNITEVSPRNKTRVLNGINPFGFDWRLENGAVFCTPQAVLCYSSHGTNGLAQAWHTFVDRHIVRGKFKHAPRPVLINNWEATYFKFSEGKLLSIAREAAKLGVELFVLDDGWFGNRENDTKGLGDWVVNTKKLPDGLTGLANKIKKIGLSFGLWFEPEMVNEDSDLYRAHPDWAVCSPSYDKSYGRNQLLLDLTRQDVRDYLLKALSETLSSADISYVKWDFNRPMSDMYSNALDNQGEFFHRYYLGLYSLLGELTQRFPDILFESCASGGNRFDLGMLCYMPQCWTSDNTDSYDRFLIQEGTLMAYPKSALGAHVSAVPNHQTLRTSHIESRFNTACIGVLGYELDLTAISAEDRKAIESQIEFYKKYREVLQYGTYYRLKDVFEDEIGSWIVVSEDRSIAIASYQNKIAPTCPGTDILKLKGLDESATYRISVRPIDLNLKQFGSLVNMVSPIRLKQDGIIHNIASVFYKMHGENESYTAKGDLLCRAGVKLTMQWNSSGYNDQIRYLGDFGSRLYLIEKVQSTD